MAGRTGPLRVLVVGGSLGAQALNDVVPRALALLPAASRPVVVHQSGTKQIDALRANYQAAGVQAEPVTEIAAIGAAALFVPFPHAVDDHQTTNARFLVDQGAGWLTQQRDLTAEGLADMLQKTERPALIQRALKAKSLQKTHATDAIVAACEELAA